MTMQSLMAADLTALFEADMPAVCMIGAKTYTVLLDDSLSEEADAFGGPESLEIQRIHFLAAQLATIENGMKVAIRQKSDIGVPKPWKSKIVVSSVLSSDGNELIATVRGD